MSAGKRHKFNGSAIRFVTSFDQASPGPMSVSAITSADPAVVTVNSTTVLATWTGVVEPAAQIGTKQVLFFRSSLRLHVEQAELRHEIGGKVGEP